jgi:hypothetical protein
MMKEMIAAGVTAGFPETGTEQQICYCQSDLYKIQSCGTKPARFGMPLIQAGRIIQCRHRLTKHVRRSPDLTQLVMRRAIPPSD